MTHYCARRRQDFERIDALGADYNAITEKLFVVALTWSVSRSFSGRGRTEKGSSHVLLSTAVCYV